MAAYKGHVQHKKIDKGEGPDSVVQIIKKMSPSGAQVITYVTHHGTKESLIQKFKKYGWRLHNPSWEGSMNEETRDKKKFSKDTFTTVGESEGFQPKGDQKDPTIGPGKNGKAVCCPTCDCDPCTCGDKKKKESQVNRNLLINRMVEKGFNKNQIKAVLKEMESEAVEAAEEKLGKDLDGDGEKGESKAHKNKVLGKKESIQTLIDRMVERGMTSSQIKAVLKEMGNTGDEFLSLLDDARLRGVPDNVLSHAQKLMSSGRGHEAISFLKGKMMSQPEPRG